MRLVHWVPVQIPALMEDVYRGEVPHSESQLLLKWVDHVRKGDNIYWHELKEAVRCRTLQ